MRVRINGFASQAFVEFRVLNKRLRTVINIKKGWMAYSMKKQA